MGGIKSGVARAKEISKNVKNKKRDFIPKRSTKRPLKKEPKKLPMPEEATS